MTTSIRRRLGALALALALTCGADAAGAEDLVVSAASSLTNAFQDVAKAYEAQHPGTHVVLNFASSDTLLRQIANGAPADVFASADQVAMDKAITVTVPIILKGEARGVKQQGGIVDFVHREIEVETLPGDIPENITVDISELMLHEGVRVRDLHIEGAKWTPISDPEMMIVHVVALKAEEEPAPAEAAAVPVAPAEPEVIKKGKVEKEEEKEK